MKKPFQQLSLIDFINTQKNQIKKKDPYPNFFFKKNLKESTLRNIKHIFVRSYKIKPEECECCHEKKKLVLSFLYHPQPYTFNIEDYRYLCVSCHMKYDLKIGQRKRYSHITSLETRKKISEKNKGRISPMKGKHHSLETLEKMRQSCKGKSSGMKGKHHSLEAKKKISEKLKKKKKKIIIEKPILESSIDYIRKYIKKYKIKSNICEICHKNKKLILSLIDYDKGYTYNVNDYRYICYSCNSKYLISQNRIQIPIHNIPHSEETKKKLSIINTSNPTKSMLGKHHSLETKKKMSMSHNGKNKPNFENDPIKKEVEMFLHFNNELKINQCPYCKIHYETRNKNKIFCSQKCMQLYHRKKFL